MGGVMMRLGAIEKLLVEMHWTNMMQYQTPDGSFGEFGTVSENKLNQNAPEFLPPGFATVPTDAVSEVANGAVKFVSEQVQITKLDEAVAYDRAIHSSIENAT